MLLNQAILLMTKFLRRGFLPFYLVQDANVLEYFGQEQRRDYVRKLYRIVRRLIMCRDMKRKSPDNMQFIFGMQY